MNKDYIQSRHFLICEKVGVAFNFIFPKKIAIALRDDDITPPLNIGPLQKQIKESLIQSCT